MRKELYPVKYNFLADLRVYPDSHKIAAAFFDIATDSISEAFSLDKQFSIALSGGNSPLIIYKYLSLIRKGLPSLINLHIYWGDERCVPPDHPESNFGNSYEMLLKKDFVPKSNIHRIKGEEKDILSECKRYASLLNALDFKNDLPSFNMILLGLGEDGHIASVFPDQMKKLFTTEQWVTGAVEPETGQKRITLTGRIINNAQEIVFIVTGNKKAKILRDIFTDHPRALNYPAYHVRPAQGKITWLTDSESASFIY